eukprot:4412848-Amphidinium_carterae.1
MSATSRFQVALVRASTRLRDQRSGVAGAGLCNTSGNSQACAAREVQPCGFGEPGAFSNSRHRYPQAWLGSPLP